MPGRTIGTFLACLPRYLVLAGIGLWCCASAGASGLGPDVIEAVRAAYRGLGSGEVEARPAAALPRGIAFERIDVSEGMRSASFGHATTLVVPVPLADAGEGAPKEFWVEYGRSTNFPARLFGPFPVNGERGH